MDAALRDSHQRPRLAVLTGVLSFWRPDSARFGAARGWRLRTEVETAVVSAVRARESRLARLRCELRTRVPHEYAVSGPAS
jgi:hypothetical protein